MDTPYCVYTFCSHILMLPCISGPATLDALKLHAAKQLHHTRLHPASSIKARLCTHALPPKQNIFPDFSPSVNEWSTYCIFSWHDAHLWNWKKEEYAPHGKRGKGEGERRGKGKEVSETCIYENEWKWRRGKYEGDKQFRRDFVSRRARYPAMPMALSCLGGNSLGKIFEFAANMKPKIRGRNAYSHLDVMENMCA